MPDILLITMEATDTFINNENIDSERIYDKEIMAAGVLIIYSMAL